MPDMYAAGGIEPEVVRLVVVRHDAYASAQSWVGCVVPDLCMHMCCVTTLACWGLNTMVRLLHLFTIYYKIEKKLRGI
jgi:hypothetical protein